jgi:hypothetical protein
MRELWRHQIAEIAHESGDEIQTKAKEKLFGCLVVV